MPVFVRIVEKRVVTVPIVHPARVIEDRIQTETLDGHAVAVRSYNFVANIVEPARALIIFCPGLRYEHRAFISFPNFSHNQVERLKPRIAATQERISVMHPFVSVVEVQPEYVQVCRLTAQFRIHSPGQHVPGLILS